MRGFHTLRDLKCAHLFVEVFMSKDLNSLKHGMNICYMCGIDKLICHASVVKEETGVTQYPRQIFVKIHSTSCEEEPSLAVMLV